MREKAKTDSMEVQISNGRKKQQEQCARTAYPSKVICDVILVNKSTRLAFVTYFWLRIFDVVPGTNLSLSHFSLGLTISVSIGRKISRGFTDKEALGGLCSCQKYTLLPFILVY